MIVLLSTKFQCLMGMECFVFIFLFGLFIYLFIHLFPYLFISSRTFGSQLCRLLPPWKIYPSPFERDGNALLEVFPSLPKGFSSKRKKRRILMNLFSFSPLKVQL